MSTPRTASVRQLAAALAELTGRPVPESTPLPALRDQLARTATEHAGHPRALLATAATMLTTVMHIADSDTSTQGLADVAWFAVRAVALAPGGPGYTVGPEGLACALCGCSPGPDHAPAAAQRWYTDQHGCTPPPRRTA